MLTAAGRRIARRVRRVVAPSRVELLEAQLSRALRAHRGARPVPQHLDCDPATYYGEIPRAELKAILDDARSCGSFERAVERYVCATGNTYFAEYACDVRRGLALRLLGDLAGTRVLDFGCGLGSLGLVAQSLGAEVVFADNCGIRLEAAAARAGERRRGAELYGCRDWRSLPASVSGFDAVLVNGVMEWVASTSGARADTVIATQLEFLHDMRSRLNAGGAILLAIENRFALKYFLGYPEDHTDIVNLSLLPRDDANRRHRAVKGTDFTTWTWALDDYDELLPRVGLRVDEAFAMFPDYRFPRLVVSLDDTEGLREGLLSEEPADENGMRRRLVDHFARSGQIRHFVYSYCFVLRAA